MSKPIRNLADILERCKETENGCLEWQMAKIKGYGYVQYKGKNYGAHRLAAIFAFGDPEPGMYALHSCDNKPCCNPNHLRWGTHMDNVRDAMKRQQKSQGEKNGNAKLKESDVAEILECLSKNEKGQDIARKYGVSSGTISNIKNGMAWKCAAGNR